jgi:N-acetylneuraminic acid mutarotase
MYVFGGRSDERGAYYSNIDFYDSAIHVLDLETLTWHTPVTDGIIPPGRRSNTLWAHAGIIYMFGGYESKNNRHFSDLHCFDPQYNHWSQLKPAGKNSPVARRRQCCVMVKNRLFLFGGTRQHDSKRSSLIDLGDLHVLDYG